MLHRRSLLVFALIALLALAVAGCKQKPTDSADAQTPETESTAVVASTPDETSEPPAPEETTEMSGSGWETETTDPIELTDVELDRLEGRLETIYFQFDSYELTDDQRALLQRNADLFDDNVNVDIRVEGHCDERGTIEYNLALGERRASVVRDYLVSLGVDASRIRIVSYGEEQPADARHEEDAWSQNRRAEFRLSS